MPLTTTPFIILFLLLLLLLLLLLSSLKGMIEEHFHSQSTSLLGVKTVNLVIISKTVGKKRVLSELHQDFQLTILNYTNATSFLWY
jgi:hypothetical protein